MVGDGVVDGRPCGIDGDIAVGHGKGGTVKRSATGSVVVEGVAGGRGVAERQAHNVALAVVERGGLAHGAADAAAAISRDAADAVGL